MAVKAQKSGRASATKPSSEEPGSTAMKLMLATERLVAARGVDGVAVRDIAQDAGVNLSAIDYHFGSKVKLVLATLDWRGGQGAEMREHQLAEFDSLERIENVEGLLRALLECHVNRPSSPGQPTHMFFARLLMDATPEIMAYFHAASIWFRSDVFLLMRAHPALGFEEACWRYYAIMGLTHLNDFDDARLRAWSDDRCDPADRGRAFDLIVRSALAILMMPASDA